jgi:CubicO group peptidase (beta-lactamase class C family)
MEGMQKTPVHFKPGTQFEYSSSTYVLLRFIIEQVTGKSYEANVKENIFNIAGMTHSGIIHNRDLIKDRALGYTMEDGKYKNALPVANHEIFIGAASMYSTAQDLLKFDQALYTEKLLKQKEKDLMFTVVQPPYGYGWFISDDAAKGKTVSHGGDIFGFTSLLERRLKNKVTIIILSNLEGVDRDKIIKAGIATGL